MDLQVYAIILIVFLVSFLSYLFISKFLPHGKTFDEMIAEKKKMREVILGTKSSASSSSSKQSNAASKKKPKKEVKKKDQSSNKQQAKEATSNESEEDSDDSEIIEEPMTPAESLYLRKNAGKNQQAKKNKAVKAGILVNKVVDPVIVEEYSVPNVNHFEETHPKDAVEIHRILVKEESTMESSSNKNNIGMKKAKHIKVETPPISPKIVPAKEVKPVEEKVVRKKRSEQAMSANVIGNGTMVDEEGGINPIVRELSRADLTRNQIQLLIDFLLNKQSDTLTKDPSEWSEGKSDLLQKLKKQLQEKEAQLKNEQDAGVGIQAKLKELRNEINAEKAQFNANMKAHSDELQARKNEIKNLTSEVQYLNEKHLSEKQSLSMSYKQLQAQCIQLKESLNSQEGMQNIQQVTEQNQLLQQDMVNKNQQIMEMKIFVDEKHLSNEESMKNLVADYEKKLTDYDAHMRKKDERCSMVENELRQRVQDLSTRETELQKLTTEVSRTKDIEKLYTVQKYDLEQLKKQLDDQEKSNHAEEKNKTEIRNLQNALDSSKKELEAQRAQAQDFKSKAEELSKQMVESRLMTNSKQTEDSFLLKEKMNELIANHQMSMVEKDKKLVDYQKQVDVLHSAETMLTKQIEEQKAKNNELRMKNWKLVEALQVAQTPCETAITTANANKKTNDEHNLVLQQQSLEQKVVADELKKVKDLVVKYFPDMEIATGNSTTNTDQKWIEGVLENLKKQLVSNKTSKSSSTIANNNLNNKTNNNHNNNNNNGSDVETNNINSNSSSNSVANGGSNGTATPFADTEILLLQNAQLKSTVEEYKSIIADTESMLTNLESKVREQDAYWQKVVTFKDNEIETLKIHSESS
ncbi:unnamed protein product [Diamesa serratosioi]